MSTLLYNPTTEEETASAVSHGIGVLLALVLYPILIVRAMHSNTPEMIWAVAVFGVGFFMTYISSTIYHSIQHSETKKVLQICDHVSIFFLIGGTYTPIICRYTEGDTALLFLGIMWVLAITGSVLKVFFTGKYEWLSLGIYLFLGWMIVFLARPLSGTMSFEVFAWLLSGGLAYTLGIFFYNWVALKYHHTIWHIFVLSGTLLHYVAIYKSL